MVSSRLPAPDDPGIFWIANLAAPYVLVPLVAGTLQRRRVPAAAAGALVCASMVVAFYQYTWYAPFVARWLLVALPVGAAAGLLGQALRTSRLRLVLAAPALVLVAEPVYWYAELGFLPRPRGIWAVEVAAGVVLGAMLAGRRRLSPDREVALRG